MNSDEVFSLEFDMLTRTSGLTKTLQSFRSNAVSAAGHRQLLLELHYLINVHSKIRELAADVVATEDWGAWHELLAVPSLSFGQGTLFADDLHALGLNSLDSFSLTPLPQTIAMEAYAHFQLVERPVVRLVGYLWFFERMPRIVYPLWHEAARRGGVPDKATRALAQIAASDPARDSQVAAACRKAVRRPRDLGVATQSLNVTMELFATLVDSALQRAERRHTPAIEIEARGIGQVA